MREYVWCVTKILRSRITFYGVASNLRAARKLVPTNKRLQWKRTWADGWVARVGENEHSIQLIKVNA